MKANGHFAKIKSRYRDSLDEILSHFSDGDNTTVENVHALRVNLKRIDALLSVLTFNDIPVRTNVAKAFKKLFAKAGRLRAIQVEFEIIKKYFDNDGFNPNYLHQLNDKKRKRNKEYHSFLERGPSKSLLHSVKALKSRMSKLSKKQLSLYLDAQAMISAKRLKRSIFREQELHLIRKDLKMYQLNLKIAGDDDIKTGNLLDLLGEWHDLQMAFDHLVKAMYTNPFTKSEKDAITAIKGKLLIDKEALYEKIVSFYTTQFLKPKGSSATQTSSVQTKILSE